MKGIYLELREYGEYGTTIKTLKKKKVKTIHEGLDLMRNKKPLEKKKNIAKKDYNLMDYITTNEKK